MSSIPLVSVALTLLNFVKLNFITFSIICHGYLIELYEATLEVTKEICCSARLSKLACFEWRQCFSSTIFSFSRSPKFQLKLHFICMLVIMYSNRNLRSSAEWNKFQTRAIASARWRKRFQQVHILKAIALTHFNCFLHAAKSSLTRARVHEWWQKVKCFNYETDGEFMANEREWQQQIDLKLRMRWEWKSRIAL